LSGLEFLRAILRGDISGPPSNLLVGIEPLEVDVGRVVMALTPGEHLYNPVGVVQGGILTVLLDAAMGCAVASTLPAGDGYTTLEIKTNFLRGVTVETGRITAEGKTIHVGGRIATAEGRVTDKDGNLIAHGTTTCLVSRGGKAG
jgi:uncharacterized protein (TIGR00369 family)